MSFARSLLATGVAITLVSTAPPALAQTPAELAARRNLLEQAQAARAAGNHAAALDLANRAGRISMHPSTRRFIAEEQQALGHLADALGSADLCVREADALPASANITAVRTGCADLATRLRAVIGRLVVRVPSPAPPGLQITVAGSPLNEALWGVESLVAPGDVVVEATAPGYQTFRQSVHVAERGSESIEINLQREGAQGSGGAGVITPGATGSIRFAPEFPPSVTTPPAVSFTIDGAPVAGNASSLDGVAAGAHRVRASAPGFRDLEQDITVTAGQVTDARFEMQPLSGPVPAGGGVVVRRVNPVGPVLIGVGGAAVIGGVAALIVGSAAYGSLRADCLSAAGCDPADAVRRRAFISSADTAGVITTIAGGAVLATGVVLTIVLRPREAPPAAMVSFDPQHGTVGMAGRF